MYRERERKKEIYRDIKMINLLKLYIKSERS